jgi:hypothetical protein
MPPRPSESGGLAWGDLQDAASELSINIISRLLEHAEKTACGLVAHDIGLPAGNHCVTLSIVDTTGKSAARTFNLSVAH